MLAKHSTNLKQNFDLSNPKILDEEHNFGEPGCPSWQRRWARFNILDDDVQAGDPVSSLAS